MSYLDNSQRVKKEIVSAPSLVDIARKAFNQSIEPFSFGGTVNLYHIGKLSAGIHVALRVLRTDVEEGKKNLESQMTLMEYYCQNAEHLYSKQEPVPEFCVGVISGKKTGIFTEDLTRGDTQEVLHDPDNAYAFVGANRRKVFIDIDGVFRYIPELELKYFLEDKLIRL